MFYRIARSTFYSVLKNEYYGHALEKIPPIKARHPDSDKDKDNDMRRKSKCNLQFVETKCNFGSLSVAFAFLLQVNFSAHID